MKFRTLVALFLTLCLGLLFAGSQAWAAAPPTLEVSVIGSGTVTGTAIDCGRGNLKCATAFGSDPTGGITLKVAPASGWSVNDWEDSSGATIGGCGNATTCAVPGWTGDQVVFAVLKTTNAVSVKTLTTTVTQDAGDEGRIQSKSVHYPIDCGTDSSGDPTVDVCSLEVFENSTITLRETTNTSYVFAHWGGGCTGSNDTCSVYMGGGRAISADFVKAGTATLTVVVTGSGTVSGGGMNCSNGATCAADEPTNATINLQATPAPGYAFTGWSDGCSGTQTTCTVQMSASATAPSVTATFTQVIPILLTVTGAGTVTGSGMACGPGPATCEGNAAPTSTIEFTATPATPTGSVSWVGCTTASGTVCTVEIGNDPIAVTANFSGTTTGGGGGGSFVQLTVSVTGNGYVSSTSGPAIWCTAAGGSGCSATVQQNTSVQLHAVSASGATTDFNGWSGSCPTTLSTSCTLLMSSAKSVGASFAGANTTFALSGSVSGSGTISGGGLKCATPGGTGCTSPEPADARIQLTATPNAGSDFTGWSGACAGSASTCTVLMSSAESVTATFTASTTGGGGGSATDTLALAVTGGGAVAAGTTKCASTGTKAKTCTSSVKDGAVLQLKATPNRGYTFTGWAGACTGTKPTCTITPNDDVSVAATFKALPIAAAAKKPAIARLRTGFRVTISFLAGEAGKVTVTTKPRTTKLTKTVKAGANVVRLTVKKHGRYTFTVSLRSKSGTHALHYRIKV